MNMTTVVISPFRTVQFLEGGGHFWVYMQYVQGLRAGGLRRLLVRMCPTSRARRQSSPAAGDASCRGLAASDWSGMAWTARPIVWAEADREGEPGAEGGYLVGTRSAADELFERRRSAAELPLRDGSPSCSARFRRTALVDIDPGLLQMWMSSRSTLRRPARCVLHDRGDGGNAGDAVPRLRSRLGPLRPPVGLDLWR